MKHIKSALFWIMLLLFWSYFTMTGKVSPLIIPSPPDLFLNFGKSLLGRELFPSLLNSLMMILFAMIPSMLFAFLMALGAYKNRVINDICERASALFHPLPGIALLPLFILWTGLGRQIIVLTVIHSVLWPFYVNMRSGFREVSPLWLDLGRNMELNDRRIFHLILIPGAYPFILSGIKVGWARAWRAVIAAEMVYGAIGGRGGLGWYIYQKRLFMDTPGMYGGIILLMITGLLIDRFLFLPLEKRLNRRRGIRIDTDGSR